MSIPPTDNRLPVLRTCRLIWAALILGCIIIATLLIARSANAPSSDLPAAPPTSFLIIAWAAALLAVPIAFITRGQTFKRGWVGDVVTPQAYATGVIQSCAVCEGATVIGIILANVPTFRPAAMIPPAISFLGLLLLYPNGKAMFPLRKPDDYNSYRFKQ